MYPKWVVRKRFWAPRKKIIYNTSVEVQDPSNANTERVSRRRRRRQAEPAREPAPRANTVPDGNNKNPSYDDIFKVREISEESFKLSKSASVILH